MKNLYQKIFLFSLGLILTSCNLDKIEPENIITEENMVVDDVTATMLLNRSYNSLRSQKLVEYTVGISVAGVEQSDRKGFGLINGFATNSVRATESNVLDYIYSDLYYTINSANYTIKKVSESNLVSSTKKNTIIAEARTIRALAHFMLLRTFGQFYDSNSKFGIVVLDKPLNNNTALARNTVQETYDLIINDLKFAIDNATSANSHFFMTKTTAAAILAKVYLYKKDYANASIYALSAINNSGGYALENTYKNIYNERWLNKEVLFAPFVDGVKEGNMRTDEMNLPRVSPSPYFINIADAQIPGNGNSLFTSGYDPRFVYSYSAYGVGESMYRANKYFHDPYAKGNTYYFLRLSELYLIYAEAEARKSDGNTTLSLQRLNQVRARILNLQPKVFTTKKQLLQDIFEEKMLELCSETGESWFDLVRYHIEGNLNATNLKPTINNVNQLIFPIPQNAMSGNKNLIQNPNY